jgi:hypothetical protein
MSITLTHALFWCCSYRSGKWGEKRRHNVSPSPATTLITFLLLVAQRLPKGKGKFKFS